MDLVLWRHAEAEDGPPDFTRKLTRRGRNEAAAMAAWLMPRLRTPWKLVASPLVRAQETALALTANFETREEIASATNGQALLAAAGWPDADGTVVLVGHQPTLGRAASLLLSGREVDCSIKKAGLWWLRSKGDRALLLAVMTPEIL